MKQSHAVLRVKRNKLIQMEELSWHFSAGKKGKKKKKSFAPTLATDSKEEMQVWCKLTLSSEVFMFCSGTTCVPGSVDCQTWSWRFPDLPSGELDHEPRLRHRLPYFCTYILFYCWFTNTTEDCLSGCVSGFGNKRAVL